MKKTILILCLMWMFASCKNNEAKVNAASTDSMQTNPENQKVIVKKEVHYVNAQPAEQPVQKKGWSSAAKGAVIGGASGAVVGAVVDKNHRVAGAAIGAAAGAGAGYLIGRHKDKKKKRTRTY